MTKRYLIIALVFVILGAGALLLVGLFQTPPPVVIAPAVELGPRHEVIGQSVEGRDIEAYTYGQGGARLLFVGGVHGGYEWNSVLLAYRLMDYLAANPNAIPENLTIAVIPSANPDGIFRVTGKTGRFAPADVSTNQAVLTAGRFNARKVDLNRNFDCKWQPTSTWRSATVSAGAKAFSEPEVAAIRDFVLKYQPAGAVFWHSQANAVYASECEAGILPETLEMADAYARASDYAVIKSFTQYSVTGDAEGWLASINIPAITVELKTHDNLDWEKNLAGFTALLKYVGRPAP